MAAPVTADEVKAVRHALGLTQQELAERLHIAVRTVARWEAGEAAPSGYLAHALRQMQSQREPPQ